MTRIVAILYLLLEMSQSLIASSMRGGLPSEIQPFLLLFVYRLVYIKRSLLCKVLCLARRHTRRVEKRFSDSQEMPLGTTALYSLRNRYQSDPWSVWPDYQPPSRATWYTIYNQTLRCSSEMRPWRDHRQVHPAYSSVRHSTLDCIQCRLIPR